jgi:ABC-2 type transport system permease protein
MPVELRAKRVSSNRHAEGGGTSAFGMFWRRTWLTMWKEFLELFRDRSLLPIVFLMPVIQLVLFGYVVSADVRNLSTAIVDQDGTVASRQVGDALLNSGYFVLAGRPVDEAGARKLMDANRAQVAVVVPKGFSEDLREGKKAPVQVIVDGTEANTGQIAAQYAGNILRNLSAKIGGNTSAVGAGPGIDARVRVWFNPTMRSVNTMVPGLLSFILLMSVTSLVAASVVKERERGTLEQIFVTPLSKTQYLLGKMLPYAVIAFVEVMLIFAVGILWFRVPFAGSLPFLLAASTLFLITSIGQGLIVSTLAHTRQQAQMVAMFIALPSMMLSGFMFPVDSMPALVKPITYLIPLRYFLVVIRSIFLKGTGPAALIPQLGAMALFSCVIFGFALLRFQKKFSD